MRYTGGPNRLAPADTLEAHHGNGRLERLSDAAGYLGSVRDRLVVLDEIHRAPELFQTLREIIDERIFAGEPAGQFLILGFASVELLRQSGESLAGRIGHLELTPLDMQEVGPVEAMRLWVRGGFPLSFLARDARASAVWRESFVRTYLERDIPELGPRIPRSCCDASGPCSPTPKAACGTAPSWPGAWAWTARPSPATWT